MLEMPLRSSLKEGLQILHIKQLFNNRWLKVLDFARTQQKKTFQPLRQREATVERRGYPHINKSSNWILGKSHKSLCRVWKGDPDYRPPHTPLTSYAAILIQCLLERKSREEGVE